MIEVKKSVNHYCVVCDDAAEYEISSNGKLKLFWANGEHDGEITLCKHCFEELRNKMNEVKLN